MTSEDRIWARGEVDELFRGTTVGAVIAQRCENIVIEAFSRGQQSTSTENIELKQRPDLARVLDWLADEGHTKPSSIAFTAGVERDLARLFGRIWNSSDLDSRPLLRGLVRRYRSHRTRSE